MGGKPARRPDHVQSLARGLAVIRAFDAGHPELTLSEVARVANLTRAATRRFLLTLVDLGYMRSDGRRFALTPRVLELGYAYLSSLTLTDVAQPHLERLVGDVRESSSVSVLDGDDVVYVARVAVARIMAVAINVGTRFPAHVTSMGRVLLAGLARDDLHDRLAGVQLTALTRRTVTRADELRAELDRVSVQGYAIVDGELEEGLRSVAVPLRDHEGGICAAMNLSTHSSRTSLTVLRQRLLPALLETAARIERDLQATQSRAQQSLGG